MGFESDDAAARELSLWYENDADLYRQRHTPTVKNYAQKMKKGNYDHKLGVSGVERNIVPDVIKSYEKQFGKMDINKATKHKIAEEITATIEQDAKDAMQ